MTIKQARKIAGWSQQKLSDTLGIPKRTIENWDAGKSACPEWAERLVVAEILRNVRIVGMTKIDENDSIVYRVYADDFEAPYTDGMTDKDLESAFFARVDTCATLASTHETLTDALLALNAASGKAFSSIERGVSGQLVRGKAFYVAEEEVDEDGDFVTGGDVCASVFGKLS